MKKRLALIALPVALLGLSACSSIYDYGYGYSDYGYGDYGPGYGSGYGYDGYAPGYDYGGASVIWHDAWYDDFYGPVYGGYWAPDGYFWYQPRIGGSYIRDYDRHFRRDSYRGYKKYRYQDNRGHGDRDWDRDRNTYPPLFKGQERDGRSGDWRGKDDRRDGGSAQGWSGRGGNDKPRGNPPPAGNWSGGRTDDRRGGASAQPRWNGNGANPNPPLFGGQTPPRVNPSPPSGGQGDPRLEGGERGDRGRWNGGGNGGDRGRDRGGQWGQAEGGSPPPPLATPPSPPPQPPPPSLWSRPKQDSRQDDDQRAGNRSNSGSSRSDDDGERGRGGKYGRRPD